MSSLSERFTGVARSIAVARSAIVPGYVALYVLMDWISFIHPMRGLNITPWNPQSAIAIAMLLWRPRAWGLVWATWVGSDLVVRGWPGSWPAELVSSALLTVGYVATAAALSRWLGRRPRLATRRDFAVFALVVGLGALLNAVLYVSASAAFDIAPLDRPLLAILRGWIGDAVGDLVVLPMLLVLGSAERRRHTLGLLRSVEWWLVALVAVASAWAVFGHSTEEQFKFFYLLFLPVVWGAARFGLVGAVWSAGLVQLLVILAVQSLTYRPLTVFELQMLMIALAATGLLLGTTVDEREEAAQALRASLHLAAAGDMAAALAHELNQPLTALRTYARASQLMAGRLADEAQQAAAPLVDVTGKLVGEANRASDVVRHLRNFFRERATDLQLASIAPLVEEVVQSQLTHAEARNVALSWRCDADVPPVWLDRVQILVVLRNLVANAIDAAAAQGSPSPSGGGLGWGPGPASAWVNLSVRAAAGQVVVDVRDSGSGIAPDEVLRVFDTRASSKPGGMGIGLGISRSIVQAHGGRMWAEPGPGGRFCFSVPVSPARAHE